MKVVVLILGVVAAALAVPVLHFEKSSGLPTRGPGRLGAIYKFCSERKPAVLASKPGPAIPIPKACIITSEHTAATGLN